jgi:hypothetical protein
MKDESIKLDSIASTNIDKLVVAVREANNISCDLLKLEDTQFDYCDYITRNGLQRCDGCIFNEETFKNSSEIVPVVYDWDFGSLDKIVGLAVLAHRPEGVYAKVTFNGTPKHEIVRNIFLDNLNEYGISFSANCIKRDPDNSNVIVSGHIRMVHITPKELMYTYREIKEKNNMNKKEKKEKLIKIVESMFE